MSLTDSNGGGLSAADVAAVTGNNSGFGFGNNDGAWWLLILFLFAGTGNFYPPYRANLYSTPINNSAYGMQMQNASNSVITVPVTNDTEVQNYLVGAGNTVIFVDFDHGKLWIKSTASNGVPMQLRKFKLSEEVPEQTPAAAPIPTEQYATKADFDELKHMIEDLLK